MAIITKKPTGKKKKVIPIVPAQVKKITSWSYSRYNDYKTCPAKAKYKHIDKLKEPGNAAMQRGADMATDIEFYVKGMKDEFPETFKKFKKEAEKFRQMYLDEPETMVVEKTWAFKSDWTPTTWDDWDGCWVRIKLDLGHHGKPTTFVVTDWKSGKYREDMHADYLEQLELYALAALILHPHVKEVRPRLAYVDLGIVYPPSNKPLIYTQKDVPRLKKLWEGRVQPMLNDTIFAPKPNRFCNWCHFRKANSGPCQF